jgi:hypothetical protein
MGVTTPGIPCCTDLEAISQYKGLDSCTQLAPAAALDHNQHEERTRSHWPSTQFRREVADSPELGKTLLPRFSACIIGLSRSGEVYFQNEFHLTDSKRRVQDQILSAVFTR